VFSGILEDELLGVSVENNDGVIVSKDDIFGGAIWNNGHALVRHYQSMKGASPKTAKAMFMRRGA
jgi:hypothetical protein